MVSVKTTRRALFTSILALLVCVSMLVGTSFAWFTDSVTSGVNKIIAGNLDVDAQYTTDGTSFASIEGVGNIFQAPAGGTTGLWEPGHVEVAYVKVANLGTLALKYQIAIDPFNEVGGTNVNGAAFLLSNVLKFAMVDYTGIYATRDAALAAAEAAPAANLSGLLGLASQTPISLAPGDNKTVALIIYMPETVGNEANYKTGTPAPEIDFAISVVAGQDTVEFDSFDEQYDANAEFGAASSVSASATADATGAVTLSAATTPAGSNITTVELTNLAADDAVVLDVTTKDTAATAYSVGAANGAATIDLALTVNGTATTDGFTAKVETYVATGLTGVTFRYSGTGTFDNGGTQVAAAAEADAVGEWYYDAATGYFCFVTDHFSEYVVSATNVAVNNNKAKAYETLQAALDDAAAGDTVIMLNDVTVTSFAAGNTDAQVEVIKNITILGNGHTISSNAGRTLWVAASNVTLTLKDLTLVNTQTNGSGYPRGLQVNSGMTGVTLNLENCSVSSMHYAVNLCAGTEVTMNATECTFTGWAGLNIWSNNLVSTLKDCDLICNTISANERFAAICLEGDTTGRTDDHSSQYTVNMIGGSITTTGQYQAPIGFNTSCENNAVILKNVTINSAYGGTGETIYYDMGTGNTLVVDGKNMIVEFTADVSGLTFDNADNSASGTVVLTPSTDPSAQITIDITTCTPTPWSNSSGSGIDYITTFEYDGVTFDFDLDISTAYTDGYCVYC